jgi:hypothetical protein
MWRVVIVLVVIGVVGALGLRVAIGRASPANSPPTAVRYDHDGLPLSPVTYQELMAHPEPRLFYPGSRVFSRFGGPEYTDAIAGLSAAFSGAVLANSATPAQIYRWYHDWLLSRHWRRHDSISVSTWTSHESYTRSPRELYTVAIDSAQMLGLTLGRKLPRSRTVYEVRYTIVPAGHTVF